MSSALSSSVVAIEILEDVTDRSGNGPRFLEVRRLRAQNRRADGSTSREYRIDVVDRPTLDAVAVLLYRKAPEGELEVLTRKNLRPAAYFRAGQESALGRDTGALFVEELVAGVLEPEDKGEAGLRHRAVEEAREEAGIAVPIERMRLLGGPFFVAPGIISELIYPLAADCTGLSMGEAATDGSPLEEGGEVAWTEARALLSKCRSGALKDAKTEIALTRLLFP